MDKVIEIVMVATVLLISAAVVLTMLNSEAEDFSDFLSGQSEDAQCDLYRETCNEAYEDGDGCDGDLPDSCDDPGGGHGGAGQP